MGDQTSAMVIPETADVMVALESTEGLRNLDFMREGGVYLVNAPDLSHMPATVKAFLKSKNVSVYHFDADGRALEQKKPLTANLYIIGFLSALDGVPFDYEELKGVVQNLSKAPFAEANLAALAVGKEAGSKA
jgi:Pyruvate/2-oxoacid:ferredoxin oxidoreductase gamma subunit